MSTEGGDVRFPWEESDDPAAAETRPAAQRDRMAEPQGAAAEAEPWARPHAADGDREDADAATDAAEPASPAPREKPIAPKEYYAISEVCDLVDLKPHVLRYWETQFGVLNPSKNRSGNRVYQRKEIKLILLVKHLLYEEKYTVEGAKQKLERMRRGGELPAATAQALDRQSVDLLRAELQRLSELLTLPEDA